MVKIEGTQHNYVNEKGEVFYIKDDVKRKKVINYSKKYPTVTIKRNKMMLKNIVAKYFVPNPNNYLYVLYKTDDYTNNTPSNLYWSKNNGGDKRGTYKKYLNKILEDFKIVSEERNPDKFILQCVKCNFEKEVKNLHNISFNCHKCKNRTLNIEQENKKNFKTWKIISETQESKKKPNYKKRIIVKCNCGKNKTINYSSFIESSFLCSCQTKDDLILKRRLRQAVRRCKNPKDKSYHRYGGRGITVCKEWEDNPESFIEWSKNNGYKENLELDRINNNGNYEPSNCRYVSKLENYLNCSIVKATEEQVIEIREKYSVKDTFKEIGKKYNLNGSIVSNILNNKTFKHLL